MAPCSSTFAWKIPWTEEPGRLQSMGSLESDTTERLHFEFSLSCIGEGNGNPLQCSCLENPRDGKPDGLPSMGSHRVGHDWSDLGGGGGSFLLAVGWGWELEGVFESVGNVLRLDSDKGPSSQSYGFSSSHVWMWELDYKAECRRIDAFGLWYWRKLLRIPWTARISN